MEQKPTKSRWSDDFDRSIIAIFGGCLGIIVVIGLFILHEIDDQNDLLSPEHIMAIIGIPGLFVMYALGHKNGQARERKKNDTDD